MVPFLGKAPVVLREWLSGQQRTTEAGDGCRGAGYGATRQPLGARVKVGERWAGRWLSIVYTEAALAPATTINFLIRVQFLALVIVPGGVS